MSDEAVPTRGRSTVRRRLVVMRHAKAEQAGASDFVRELSARGVADAEATGRWLVEQGVEPDHALVSAAVRTSQTWESVAAAAGWSDDATYEDALYEAGPETALDLIRETPDEARTLMVVGHNPTMAYLVQLLDDGDGDEDASAAISTGYPTAAVTVFDLEGDWTDVEEQCATLVAHHVARAAG
ncbi:histidine phosphatase family protein [Nocardioides sp. TRM66260-LWL]|uniref:SixA phosphatase family protein n=1 Tax=Nocardioides sp. TRM66260-LWL TaxID=2874478 RepID=UPI001CC6A42D|nr:histidine phosphatase family protein [Nocardioides sp. TRM66260-LWL]MBZ5733926.1 histidine phosphatase family protein [Nocardioides sp. TRM66260-LWL]